MFFNEFRIHKSAGLAGSQAQGPPVSAFSAIQSWRCENSGFEHFIDNCLPRPYFYFWSRISCSPEWHWPDLALLSPFTKCWHFRCVPMCRAKFTSKSSFRLKAELSRRNFASPRQAYTFSHHTWQHPSGWQMQQPFSHAGISQTLQFTLGLTCSSVLSAILDTWWHVMVIPFSWVPLGLMLVHTLICQNASVPAMCVPGCFWAFEHLFGKLVKRRLWYSVTACATRM